MLTSFIAEGLKGKPETTIKTYRHAIEQFEKWLNGAGTDLVGFTRDDVQQYIFHLNANKKSPSTINKVWNAIKKFAKWSNKLDTIEGIRVIKLQNPKSVKPKVLEPKELWSLFKEVHRTGSKRDIAIIKTLANTGIRVAELASLNKDDIEISESKGEVKVIGKNNKERIIPLCAETLSAITTYLNERSDNQQALFISNKGQRISVRSIQMIVKKYGVKAHTLRHTYITNLILEGMRYKEIQLIIGHSSIDLLSRYLAPTE